MECFNCKHKNLKNSHFCSNCGRNFKKNNNTYPESTKSIYPYSESINKLNEIILKKQHNMKQLRKILFSIAIISFIIVWAVHNFQFANLYLYGFLFIGVIIFSFSSVGNLNSFEYYQIPYSKDNNGQHQCIFCGNHGIYKHGQYKTNYIYNKCSKCKKLLFMS